MPLRRAPTTNASTTASVRFIKPVLDGEEFVTTAAVTAREPTGVSLLSKRIGQTTRALYDLEPGARNDARYVITYHAKNQKAAEAFVEFCTL